MIIWQLWQGLFRRKPIYALYAHQYMHLKDRAVKSQRAQRRWNWLLWALILVPTAMGVVLTGDFTFLFSLVAAGALLVCAIPSMLPFLGILLGSLAAMRVASSIAIQRELNRLDLLLVTPGGRTGMYWMLANMGFRSSRTITRSWRMARNIYIIFGLFMWLVASNDDLTTSIPAAVGVSLGLTALYLDLMFSLIAGVLIGMGISTYLEDRLAAQTAALGTFIGFQLAYYFIALIAIALLSRLLSDGGAIIGGLAWIVCIGGLRVLTVVMLQAWLARRLEITLTELDDVIRTYA